MGDGPDGRALVAIDPGANIEEDETGCIRAEAVVSCCCRV
jgi:hypothetical protein